MTSRWLKALGEFSLPFIAVALLLPAGVMVGVKSPSVNAIHPATSVAQVENSTSHTLTLTWCGEQKDHSKSSRSVCPFKLAQGFSLSQAPLVLNVPISNFNEYQPDLSRIESHTVLAYQAQAPPVYS
jgi:hypothetical protein